MRKALFFLLLFLFVLGSLAHSKFSTEKQRIAKRLYLLSIGGSQRHHFPVVSSRQSRRDEHEVQRVHKVVLLAHCASRSNVAKRRKFLTTACQAYNRRYRMKYNVMIFNLEQPYSRRLRGIRVSRTIYYCGIPYHVWLFRSGSFENRGAPDAFNWCFRGHYRSCKNHITFSKR